MPGMGRKRIRRRLNGAARMKSSLCFKVRCMSKLRRVEQPKIGVFASWIADSCLPAFAYSSNAKKSRFVVQSRLALILLIHACRHLSKVCKTIVRSASIDVIDLLVRPFAMDVQPRQPMIQMGSAINLGLQISIPVSTSGSSSSTRSTPRNKPLENTSLLVVAKKLAQSVLCDHVAPHQSGKPSKDAASGDESPVPRRVSCQTILPTMFAKSSDCGTISLLSRPSSQ